MFLLMIKQIMIWTKMAMITMSGIIYIYDYYDEYEDNDSDGDYSPLSQSFKYIRIKFLVVKWRVLFKLIFEYLTNK